MIKEDTHIFQGMKRDNHPIRQDSKFLWDALNIRLTNREDDTLLSITNERGNINTGVTFIGSYVGHCIVGNYLIVFTTESGNTTGGISTDRIYRVNKTDNGGYINGILYKGNLNLNTRNPIEALGVYENELLQKVYWVDGINQPRVINVTKPELILSDSDKSKLINGFDLTTFSTKVYPDNSFEFVRNLTFGETINVTRINGTGEFPQGIIQYAFSYYSRYGQESNIFYTTPLNYISFIDRGAKADEKVPVSFKIDISNPDINFDCIRVYSIHRTSLDGIPTVKIVKDISLPKTSGGSVTYIDDGLYGETVDNTRLLYVGGREIVPKCIEQKDGTLFLGNIELKNEEDWLNIKTIIRNQAISGLSWNTIYNVKVYENSDLGNYYNYIPNIDFRGFKSRETYRCGIQFQSRNGSWSEPIFLGDKILNDTYPCNYDPETYRIKGITWRSKKASIYITDDLLRYLNKCNYVRARACVVFPTIYDRNIICQGILNPTVFSTGGRSSNSPFAMSSWIFRPKMRRAAVDTGDKLPAAGAFVEFKHNKHILTGGSLGAEIQCIPYVPNESLANRVGLKDVLNVTNSNFKPYHFYIDENIVTFHSPDIEFDTSLQNITLDQSFKLNIIGATSMDAVYGNMDIHASQAPNNPNTAGPTPTAIGRQVGFNYDNGAELTNTNGGLVSWPAYTDTIVRSKTNTPLDASVSQHMVYMWHRSGSLNNSGAVNTGTRSAVLQKKTVFNLKYFNSYIPFPPANAGKVFYRVEKPLLFSSNEVSLGKVWVKYRNQSMSYFGNVDTMVSTDTDYPLALYRIQDWVSSINQDGSLNHNYGAIFGPPFKSGSQIQLVYNTLDSIERSQDGNDPVFKTSRDPVRIKYKSSPHMVFSLQPYNIYDNSIALLPTYQGLRNVNIDGVGQPVIPEWDSTVQAKVSAEDLTKDCEILVCILRAPLNGNYEERLPDTTKENVMENDYALVKHTNATDRISPYRLYKCMVDGEGKKSWIRQGTFPNVGLVLEGGSQGTQRSWIDDGNGLISEGSLVNNKNDISYHKYVGDPIKFIGSNAQGERLFNVEKANLSGVTDGDSPEVLNYMIPTIQSPPYKYPTLFIAELERENVSNKFGGDSNSALQNNLWVPAGEPVAIPGVNNYLQVEFKYGDTWYSRYDCLKTYPFTLEDENQVVEIGSFMVETRVNIDGRCDKNRGRMPFFEATPNVFNLMNDVYTQKDNFFNYHILNSDFYKQHIFNNQLTWSLQKNAGSDIDDWTNITVANTLDLDGKQGKLNAIKAFNSQLLAFQDKAVSVVNFNSRVQIPVSEGVPIEISNGYKVDGSTIISDSVGCQNKWSICPTVNGLFFIDTNTDTIWLYNGKLNNISDTLGLRQWVTENHSNYNWTPYSLGSYANGIRTFYDYNHGDVYFTPGGDVGDNREALCYSEKLGQFTSRMSYGGTQAMFSLGNSFYSLYHNPNGNLTLWDNFKGEYNHIYNKYCPFNLSFISNDNPLYTKVFDTIEYQADVYEPGGETPNRESFNYIRVENEYQDTGEVLFNTNNLKKKFRNWRALIPRSSEVAERSMSLEDTLRVSYGKARIRNPWTKITLGCNKENSNMMVFHNATVKYTV